MYLSDWSNKRLTAQCGKMQLLDRLLTRLQAGGHKVLIFSQVSAWLRERR